MNPIPGSDLERALLDYPDLSPFVLLKLSLVRRGAVLTDRALDRVQQADYSFGAVEPFGIAYAGRERSRAFPGAMLLRDASNVFINYGDPYTDPYSVDFDPERGVFLLLDQGVPFETVDFTPRPAFFGKTTSRGTSMEAVADARAQKLIITALQRCRLWESGDQCGFCAFFTDSRNRRAEIDPGDIAETVGEALKETGRFCEIYLSGGIDFGGKNPFDDEVDRYIRVLQAIGQHFSGRFSSQLMAPAYTKAQVKRLYDETGLTSYCPNIEVWDARLFSRLCPGKSKWIGRDAWIARTLEAVEIFGRGNVYTQVVAGAELAAPDGFDSVEAALESNFEACEFFSKQGIVFLSTIWRPHRAARLGYQLMPPLDYYIRLAKGIRDIRREYGLVALNDDYKHCGNHPDSDLERLD